MEPNEQSNEQIINITEADIKAEIINRRKEIVTAITDGMVASATDSLRYSLSFYIREEYEKQIKTIIAEESAAVSENFRQGVVVALREVSVTIGAVLATTILETAKKNLCSSYKAEQIFKQLFD